MLYSLPELEDADLTVLAEIEDMRNRLRLHLRTPRRWEGQLRRNLTARAIAGSNTIEGYAASVSDVEDIMVGETPIEASDTVAVEIEGYRQAMTYIQRLAEAAEDFAYSKGLLNALHFMMQGHHLVKRPGWWRTGPVYVTSAEDPTIAAYTAPDADLVPVLTGELVEWLNEGDLDAPGLVRASMAHLNLVAIHPWSDGNGRMSRALHTLVLAREGIMAPEFSSIEEWLGRARNTYRYYDVLAEVGGPVWTPERDTLPWLRFCLRAHHQQAQSVERQVNTTREVWTALDEAVEQRGWPDRMLYALYPAAMGNRLRRATYQADAELSEQQAQRDIRELVRAGWLTAKGEAQGRYYTAGPDLPEEITRGVRQPRPLRDPYA
ncbi:Fic family protein [Kitasatospora aureofaciens]|uniref:Fic family protein n=1 Tax=Kitasatospora aureofaciens TaxID=1894 RepID=UPI001C46A00E|nr:Fic family protein [Kitasatospora aureofaciens]MBV6703078.1 Fic family protein [Kitasatospora aureofaciens]